MTNGMDEMKKDELWKLSCDIVIEKYIDNGWIDDENIFWGSVDIEYEKLLRSYKIKQLNDNIIKNNSKK